MGDSKQCNKCGIVQPLNEYYVRESCVDGHEGTCKSCRREIQRAYYASNRDRVVDYDRRRSKLPSRQLQSRSVQDAYRERHPEKYKARGLVSSAIRSGRLHRQPCEFCGNIEAQAHHDDYSRPLDVTWVCFKCHREKLHGQIVTQPVPA